MNDKIRITEYQLYLKRKNGLFSFDTEVTHPYIDFYVPLEEYEIHSKGENVQHRESFDLYMEELTHEFLESKNIKADIIGYVKYEDLKDVNDKLKKTGYSVKVTLTNIENKNSKIEFPQK